MQKQYLNESVIDNINSLNLQVFEISLPHTFIERISLDEENLSNEIKLEYPGADFEIIKVCPFVYKDDNNKIMVINDDLEILVRHNDMPISCTSNALETIRTIVRG